MREHGMRGGITTRGLAVLALAVVAAAACARHEKRPRARAPLSKAVAAETRVPIVPVPPADGPQLGALANSTPIVDRPGPGAEQLGYMHAGSRVARAVAPYTVAGCPGGWFPVRPRGFVCAGAIATTDLAHPTLSAMAMQPNLQTSLPYSYARLVKPSAIFKAKSPTSVEPVGQIARGGGLAVVGSWTATDVEGVTRRLAMMTDGRFIDAEAAEAARESPFHGVELGKDGRLPLAFVVKRGVRSWKASGASFEKGDLLDYHRTLALTGRFRSVGDQRFWAATRDRWVRARDVTIVPKRDKFPPFASTDQKWMDVSATTGTIVLYEGVRPVFATLVSVGREGWDGTADDGTPSAAKRSKSGTLRGIHTVVGKHITTVGFEPKGLAENLEMYDVPWALELSSGQMVCGAYWHDRFGVEYGTGALELSPADAARVWRWADPELPAGWHGVSLSPGEKTKTIVVIR